MTRAQLALDAFDLPYEVVEERMAWARRRGHPHFVWPDIDLTRWDAARREIERVVRAVLSAETPVTIRSDPDDDGKTFGIAAFTSGMGPLLGHWLQEGCVESPEPIAAILRVHREHSRRRADHVATIARDTIGLLHSASVPCTVLKATHTAREYFPEPAARPANDIDLLISEADVETAAAALRRGGYELWRGRAEDARQDWWPPTSARRIRSLELVHANNPIPLEMHTSLRRVFYRARDVDIDPTGVQFVSWDRIHPAGRVLAQPWLLAFLALHASEELKHLQLVRLVELISVVRTDIASGVLTWDALADVLDRFDAFCFAYPALELAERLAPGTLDPAFREQLRTSAPKLMQRVMDQITPTSAQQVHRESLAMRFMWARYPWEFVRCAFYLFLPGRHNPRPFTRVMSERFFRLVRGRIGLSQ